jgi:rhamnosyltransferase
MTDFSVNIAWTAVEPTPAGRIPGPPRICAVVVTHHPRSHLDESLAVLAPQVSELLIVDNGSSAPKLAELSAAAAMAGATVLALGANRGIAHALNVGLRAAQLRGCQWLATFDQDSLASPAMLREMLHAAQSYPGAERVAVISPVHVDRRLGISLATRTAESEGPLWRVQRTAMTSGNLVDVAKVSAVGGFEEGLFIDYVDHELCLRLRRHGYEVLEARHARLQHSLGEVSAHPLGRQSLRVTNHSAVRRYYMSRNRLILWGRYARTEGSWVRRDMRGFVTELAGIVLFEEQSLAKLRMIARGAWDAIRGVRGPISAPLPPA